MSDLFIMFIWIWVCMMFVIVEGIKLWRLASRIRINGLNRGIGQYNVTQWSRIFTFGMFYTFTMQFDGWHTRFSHIPFLDSIRAAILKVGAWGHFLFVGIRSFSVCERQCGVKSVFLVRKKEGTAIVDERN